MVQMMRMMLTIGMIDPSNDDPASAVAVAAASLARLASSSAAVAVFAVSIAAVFAASVAPAFNASAAACVAICFAVAAAACFAAAVAIVCCAAALNAAFPMTSAPACATVDCPAADNNPNPELMPANVPPVAPTTPNNPYDAMSPCAAKSVSGNADFVKNAPNP